MRRVTLSLVLAFAGFMIIGCGDQGAMEDTEGSEEAAPAAAPLADFAGTWNSTAFMESGDTVPYTLTATTTTDGWMIDLPERDPMPVRVVSVSGDTVVTEIGPYESILRPGVMVTVRSVSYLQDGGLEGTMEATYDQEGESTVVNGRTTGTRGM